MSDLPVAHILWAGNNADHDDHLHVEGIPTFHGHTDGTGDQPPTAFQITNSVQQITQALEYEFGAKAYFLDEGADDADWQYMGIYNRRPIAGSTTWSQHAWGNAIDIGPYYGVTAQQEFYDFLTGDYEMVTAKEIALEVWNTKVSRAGKQVPAIQELADIKTLLLINDDVSDSDLDEAVDTLIRQLPDKVLAALKAKL